MKMVPRLFIVAIIASILAAPPASARMRHHSKPQAAPVEQSFPEMTISDQWSPDAIVAPPVTRPSGISYDTPKPHLTAVTESASNEATSPEAVASASAQTPAAGDMAASYPSQAAVPTAANPDGTTPQPVTISPAESTPSNLASTRKPADNNAASPLELMSATVHGAKIDGASITSPQTGMQTAALIAPSASNQKSGATQRTPGSILFDQTRDDSALDPTNWSVSVFKHRQALIVYFKGRLFHQYDAVFGRALDLGAKQWAQDRRTPEGVYTIIEKYHSARFRWFLRLNYPNLVDRVRYETQRVNGVVPVDGDGKSPTVGSAIGIHGTDVPILNAG
ncbi:MAG TPA: L,D-transpeptidase family protein, partial [Candidatus Binataceae bacterium]|nr:L,D-transpeptidase family protein [Candidatus Binataceae bacterium]